MQKITDSLLKNSKTPFYVTVMSSSVIGTNTTFKIKPDDVYCVKSLEHFGLKSHMIIDAKNTKDGKVTTSSVHRFRLAYKNEERLCKY